MMLRNDVGNGLPRRFAPRNDVGGGYASRNDERALFIFYDFYWDACFLVFAEEVALSVEAAENLGEW